MSILRAKWLAAGVVVVCGLCAGGRAGWVATADAQSAPLPPLPAGGPPAADDKVEDKLRKLQAELDRARAEAELARKAAQDGARAAVEAVRAAQPTPAVREVKAPAADYDYVLATEMGKAKFTDFLRDREAKGWEFKGEATLTHEGKSAPHWVFKKAAQATRVMTVEGARATALRALDWSPKPRAEADARSAEERALEAELKVLGEKLAALRGKSVEGFKVPADGTKPKVVEGVKVPPGVKTPLGVLPPNVTATVKLTTLSAEELAERAKAVFALAPNKAGDSLRLMVDARTNAVTISGPADAVKWAVDVIRSLDGSKPAGEKK